MSNNINRTQYTISSSEDNEKIYYYIHRHINDFAERSPAMDLFQRQKESGLAQAKLRYAHNYLKNVSPVSLNAQRILNAAMSEEEIVNYLDDAFTETITNKMSSVQSFDLQKSIIESNKAIKDYLNTKDLKKLDNLFAQISKASEILQKDNNYIVFLLGQNNYRKDKDLKKLQTMLDNKIAELNNKATLLNISQQRLLSAAQSLSGLISAIADDTLNKNNFSGYLSNIFSTQIGEYLMSRNVQKMCGLGLKETRDSLVGSKNVEIDEDDITKTLISEYGQKGDQSFKTDNSFSNLELTIDEDGNDGGYNYTINLGLSTKWYKGDGKNNNKVYDVKITTETSYQNRLNQMFLSQEEKYYAYNALGLSKQDKKLYQALNNSIIYRNIDVLISGIGINRDFSQYIVVNGKFYSIWQIINLLDASKEKKGLVNIEISLNEVTSLTQKYINKPKNLSLAYVRCKEQNNLINNLGFTAHFYPNRFINLVKQNS